MRSTANSESEPLDLGSLSDAAVLDRLRELQRQRCALNAEFARTVAVAHARGSAGYDGCVSTKAWLRGHLRLSRGEANTDVDVAGVLADLPRFAALFATGRVSIEHVAVLAELHKKAGPEIAGIADTVLPEYALRYGPAEIRRLANAIRQHYAEESDDGPPPEPDRFFKLAQTFGGTWSLDGALTPEAGSMLRAALDAATTRPAPDDDRSADQRRHDAFADLVRLALNGGELPTKRGERPHLGVLVPFSDLSGTPPTDPDPAPPSEALETYLDAVLPPADAVPDSGPAAGPGVSPAAGSVSGPEGRPDAVPEVGPEAFPELQGVLPTLDAVGRGLPRPGQGGVTDHGGRVSPEAARRLACDAQVYRIVMSPKNLPLDLGQRVRLVPAALRRALVARDRGRRFPFCDMPSAYTEAHHVCPWQQGGPTEPGNLLLLCSYHHHRVHDDHWTIRYHPRSDTVTACRPDGTRL